MQKNFDVLQLKDEDMIIDLRLGSFKQVSNLFEAE